MSGNKHWEQDKEATVYIGNLDERVTDSIVWELMLQAGRIVNVHLPKDRVTQTHQGYGFVEFISEEDAEYAARIMNQIRLFGKPVRVNKASADKQKTAEVGAELFVGNLDPMVTEQILFDTFSRFGTLVSAPKVARDDSGLSKGYGFVSFNNFESSDDAIASLHGQYLMNKEVSVQYAYKKDGKGERHGDQAERMLAAQAREHNVQPPVHSLPTNLTTGHTASAHAILDSESNSAIASNGPSFATSRMQVQGSHLPNTSHQPRNAVTVQSLPPAPSGLPPRPPPSQVGYGGPPPGFLPPGFSAHSPSPGPLFVHTASAPGFGASQASNTNNRR